MDFGSDISERFARWLPRLDARLRMTFEQARAVRTAEANPEHDQLLTELATLVGRGGKRLRPLISLLFYEGYAQSEPSDAVVQVAASLELLHTFLLIHDDIIDRDTIRWGGQNITGVYIDRFATTMPHDEAQHYAEAWALLAGDYCSVLASDLVMTASLSAEVRVRLHMLQQAVLKTVIAGQLADVAYGTTNSLPSEADVLRMYHDKTAIYSFTLPSMTAAIMAGVSSKERVLLSNLSAALGIAYQLQDDLLDTFGNTMQTGKTVGTDIREGKQTVLLARGLALASNRERKQLLNIVGNRQATDAQITQVAKYLENSGAREAVESLVTRYTKRAHDMIVQTTLTSQAQRMLIRLSQTLITRQS